MIDLEELRRTFADPPPTAAPMMRWWWFGPSVNRTELERELEAMAAAGFGGVEVAYVYPLGSPSESGDVELMSADFLADLRFAAECAQRLGLRFDLTLGSGWSFGGPHIGPDLAARRLHWEQREIGPGAHDVPVVSPWPGDELIAAYLGAGSKQEHPDAFVLLPVTDETIRIPDGTGTRVVLLGYAQLTGQNVKRAARGAEGPVLDHYSAAATQAHLRWGGDPMLDAVPADLVGSVFCDSLEVYESDWTPVMPAEFANRRGYPLLPELHLLITDGPDSDRVRADYHRTLVELYQENFVAVIQRWAAGRGVPFRIQGYGTPPATVSSYRFADLFEGEGWGWQTITQTRWASSAAHLYGRPLASAEIWTWVHSPSFRATPLDLLGEAHEHLLNGINQFIGHGWPYSPADAPGLGWFFYAAGAIDDRNPWWPAMPELNRQLTRSCWLLRQGEPVADAAVYVPNEDLFAQMGRAQGGSLDTWREARQRIDAAVPETVRALGLDYDLIDDDALSVTSVDRYPVIIVADVSRVPPAATEWLARVIAAGGSVITIDSAVHLPGSTPVTSSDLGDELRRQLGAGFIEPADAEDIGLVRRRTDGAEIYFLANTGPHPRAFSLALRDANGIWEQWDPRSGSLIRTGEPAEPVSLALDPYQATAIIATREGHAAAAPPDHDAPSTGSGRRPRSSKGNDSEPTRRILADDWQVTFGTEPAEPVQLPHAWEDDPNRRHYSGPATYRTTVELEEDIPGTAIMIDFGPGEAIAGDAAGQRQMVGPSYRAFLSPPVGEIAEVRVNGIDCGIAWAPPYRVDVSGAIRPGQNVIELVVSNTAANALGVDRQIRDLAADSEAGYGRRFRMQELDLAMATVRSGLLAVPSLIID